MTATVTDDRRRVVMPPELPAKSPITIQQIDEDTWIVKRQRKENVVMVSIPIISKLPTDTEWEKKEQALARHTFQNMAPFEE